MARYEQRPRGVFDNEAGRLLLPRADGWDDYQRWLAAGHRPDAMPVEPEPELSAKEVAARAELAARRAIRNDLAVDGTVHFLRTHTPSEVDAWVVANVTDLASAKTLLRKLAVVVAYLARERLAPEPTPEE